MKLTTMQDIGGCRAVVSTLQGAHQLADAYQELAVLGRLDVSDTTPRANYIAQPKAGGYRGIHLIGRYQTTSPRHEVWKGARIEIQIRTRLSMLGQRLWRRFRHSQGNRLSGLAARQTGEGSSCLRARRLRLGSVLQVCQALRLMSVKSSKSSGQSRERCAFSRCWTDGV